MMLKKLICVLIILCVLLAMLGAAAPDSQTTREAPESLKVLCIGNSFTQDIMAYLPMVLRESLPETEVTVGLLHTSSATLANHLQWIDEGRKYHAFLFWRPDRNAWKRFYSEKSVSLERALELRDWDVISFHGVCDDILSDEAREQMFADAARLTEWLRQHAQKPVVLMWIERVGIQKESLPPDEIAARLRDAAIRAEAELDIDAVIPIGDSFQIARENEELRKIGTSPAGNLLYMDNAHLQAGLPDLLASYTAAAAILHYYGLDVERIERSTWVPTNESVVEIRANNEEGSTVTHGFPDGVTPENVALAKKIAAESVLRFADEIKR